MDFNELKMNKTLYNREKNPFYRRLLNERSSVNKHVLCLEIIDVFTYSKSTYSIAK